jgi:protein-tyrosine phosphatase
MVSRILIVCTGNVCRSPMAAGLLAQTCPQFTMESAGLNALVGYGADPLAVEVMAERNIDIKQHRAQQVTRAEAVGAHLILVMELAQKRELERLYPEVRGRVFRFADHLGVDVPDPTGKPKSFFLETRSLIEHCVTSWAFSIARTKRAGNTPC